MRFLWRVILLAVVIGGIIYAAGIQIVQSEQVIYTGLTTREIYVAGGFMTYSTMGSSEAQPVVLIHDIGGRFEEVLGQDYLAMQRLAEKYYVIMPDLPGMRRSFALEREHSRHEYTAMIKEFVEKMKLGKPILMGEGLGGLVALTYMENYPRDVAAVVLAEPSQGWVKTAGSQRLALKMLGSPADGIVRTAARQILAVPESQMNQDIKKYRWMSQTLDNLYQFGEEPGTMLQQMTMEIVMVGKERRLPHMFMGVELPMMFPNSSLRTIVARGTSLEANMAVLMADWEMEQN